MAGVRIYTLQPCSFFAHFHLLSREKRVGVSATTRTVAHYTFCAKVSISRQGGEGSGPLGLIQENRHTPTVVLLQLKWEVGCSLKLSFRLDIEFSFYG